MLFNTNEIYLIHDIGTSIGNILDSSILDEKRLNSNKEKLSFNFNVRDIKYKVFLEFNNNQSIVFVLTSSLENSISNFVYKRVHVSNAPGNCGIVYITNVFNISEGEIGKKFLSIIEEVLKLFNFTIMTITTVDDSFFSLINNILKDSNWKETFRFTNKRTGNIVINWIKEIK